jgi:hypothetical protein
MPVLRNPRHEKVAQLIASQKSFQEAAREAGYPVGTSFKANARRLSHHPAIRARVTELQETEASLVVVDVAWIKRKTAEVASVEIAPSDVKASDKIAALNLLAKMTPGALVPQTLGIAGQDGKGPVEFAWKLEESPSTMRHGHSSAGSTLELSASPVLSPTAEPEKPLPASTTSSEGHFQVTWSDPDSPT